MSKEKIFEIGKRRTSRMFDVVRLFNHIQELKIFSAAVLSEKQTTLAQFQKNMIIGTSSDEEGKVWPSNSA